MDIIYFGQSSFKISGKSASVVTDPFDPKMLGINFPKVAADIVTISHAHKDHNFKEGVSEVYKVLESPGEFEIKGVSFLGFSSFHDNEKGEKRGKNIIFVIEIDGFRIAHLGDLGHTLSESMVTQIGTIDILFVPVGGEYTVGPQEASAIVKAIEPSIVIPMHYKLPGLNTEISEKLKSVDEFTKELGVVPEHTTKLTIKEGGLPPDMKVIIVDRK